MVIRKDITSLSTHPAPESRIANIRGYLPEALCHFRMGN